ncbi:hypothetical protein A2V68_02080 [candidate division Kazan bacterium RBG_13_50_9]|uniref:PDGLE domain-containing protein n=1 Tax=candidate division Kazan bacterium RBG_13_50_9 TaxID=1798535 RepID=A0A1F4NRP3_UNCK3|nr:MAG: hypothetical protein A2V68_02080 [candidate division Kazan bacterium RBG_13_50_9]
MVMNRAFLLAAAMLLALWLPVLALAQGTSSTTESTDEGVSLPIPGLEDSLDASSLLGSYDQSVADDTGGAELETEVGVTVDNAEGESASEGIGTVAGWIVAGVAVLAVVYFLFSGLRR